MGFVGHIVVVAGMPLVIAGLINLLDWKGIGVPPPHWTYPGIPIGGVVAGLGAWLVVAAEHGKAWDDIGNDVLTVAVALIAGVAAFAAVRATWQANALAQRVFDVERERHRENLTVVPRLSWSADGPNEYELRGEIELVNNSNVPAIVQLWSTQIFFEMAKPEGEPEFNTGRVSLVVPPNGITSFECRTSLFVGAFKQVAAYGFSVHTTEGWVYTTFAQHSGTPATRRIRPIKGGLFRNPPPYAPSFREVVHFIENDEWPYRV